MPLSDARRFRSCLVAADVEDARLLLAAGVEDVG
jgi:hypothetical protein